MRSVKELTFCFCSASFLLSVAMSCNVLESAFSWSSRNLSSASWISAVDRFSPLLLPLLDEKEAFAPAPTPAPAPAAPARLLLRLAMPTEPRRLAAAPAAPAALPLPLLGLASGLLPEKMEARLA